ncbi:MULTISPECIES: GntR family transcriptional regulator [Mycolicibacterium]|jgi:GntR family transcriptional regulator|uniref:Transcriptional regulator, GntR family n=4 Tax=Mycolicibacterium TaxID=1866885 RepID=A1T157_MYCVP|nr:MULTISPECIES: GntR family transcriptional regulator [Mycolicibacterium]ABM10907.1 transcriptional regulator, GntR family [Mycolicibacterium vanbaalenii PYR-1]MDN4516411.1 GntR family transcriptional regulator [Mycolicibacterium austroafricanum]QRZ07067.1 GntR family transcriptional regulator [Mycolicibacterium austroafricanum]QZT55716.1 GntR family transcriptional regulator [Mycolicibacterium austroafricanum]QZT68552.1 GntR family transcriptional regulator [Mycolicibacterium austroafricanum
MNVPKPYLVRTGLDGILDGLQEGDPFPPERELAARFGVARETVRQALHELLVEGRIERRGRGTVVSRPKLVQPLSLRSYTEGAQRMGRTPGRLLVTWENITVDAEIAAALDVSPSARVMHLERVLLADDVRIGLESTYLPRHRFGDLEQHFDPTTSLYSAIRARGVKFGSATERIETVLPSPREAELLESTTAMPMLLLNRRSVDVDGVPIEVVRALYRGDRVAFEATLDDR